MADVSARSPAPARPCPLPLDAPPIRLPPKISCRDLCAQAARDGTQLYLSLLTSELRSYLDCFVHTPAWHFTSEMVKLEVDLAAETMFGYEEVSSYAITPEAEFIMTRVWSMRLEVRSALLTGNMHTRA